MGIFRDIRNERIAAGKLVVGKGLLRSKTFWANVLGGAATALSAAGTLAFLPAPVAPYLAAGLAIVNVLLRLVSTKPIVSVK